MMREHKTYEGWIDAAHNPHVTVNGKPLRLVEHHTDEFNWGYGGSGPATLALSILADYFGEQTELGYVSGDKIARDVPRAWEYHQEFKEAFVSGWGQGPEKRWRITSDEIDAWLTNQLAYEIDWDGIMEARYAQQVQQHLEDPTPRYL